MKYLFSKPGIQVLESLAFTGTLYAFDFDGTLAPIVSTPDKAKPSKATESLLQSISEHAPTAVISGRALSDLKRRLSFIPDHLIGNHGLEGLSLHNDSSLQAHSICESWSKQLQRNWKFESGIFVEDKIYSLALHYRRARNKKGARIKLFQKIEKLNPAPRIILGKCVMNLIPTGAPHKGVALLELMMHSNLKCALYVGDDDTDEDVFSLPDARIISVRVGEKKSSNAQFFIKRQSEMNRLLKLVYKNVRVHK